MNLQQQLEARITELIKRRKVQEDQIDRMRSALERLQFDPTLSAGAREIIRNSLES